MDFEKYNHSMFTPNVCKCNCLFYIYKHTVVDLFYENGFLRVIPQQVDDVIYLIIRSYQKSDIMLISRLLLDQ